MSESTQPTPSTQSNISTKPRIVAYLKPFCGWSNGVRAILTKYSLSFEDRDIWNDSSQREEMIRKSGQELSPCVEIDGHMLADVSGEEVEAWLIANKVVTPNNSKTPVPTNQPCLDHGPKPVSVEIKWRG